MKVRRDVCYTVMHVMTLGQAFNGVSAGQSLFVGCESISMIDVCECDVPVWCLEG